MSAESSSQKGGRFSFKNAPWQQEVLDAPDDPAVSSVVCEWASQVTGKTETVNNILFHKIDIDPCPILLIQPTLAMGDTWSKDRLIPGIRDTPRLRGKVKDARSKDPSGANTILHKKFPGGHLTIAGANSPSSLASRPIRIVLFDEIDRYPFSAGTEGDPIALAEKRTESFPDAVTVKVSTPLIKGTSRIEKAFAESDRRYWFCDCPRCNFRQTLRWANVKWENDDPATARLQCEGCGALLTDDERQKMVRAGRWQATAPFKGIRGYHINGIYCLFRPTKPNKTRLEQMVRGFLSAKRGGKETLQVWTNTFLAEAWEDEAESVPEIDALLDRREEYPDHLPAGICMLTAQVDVQGDRLEAEVDGWGIGEERWKLVRQVFVGNPEQEYVWEQLDSFLSQTFATEEKQILSVVFAFIDRRHKGKAVDAFTKRNNSRGWFSCQGGKAETLPVVSGPKKTGVTKAYVYTIGTYEAKRIIYSRLHISKPGPRYTHFPLGRGFDEDYFRQLTAERLVTEYTKTGPKKQWKKMHDRNEALDLAVYGLAAMIARRPNFEAIARNLAKTSKDVQLEATKKDYELKPEPKPDEPQPAPTQPKQATRPQVSRGPRKNFIQGWRQL